MPIGRGETIGTAYVRILADGRGFGESVRDALDDDDVFDEFDQSGREASNRWTKAFKEEQKRAPKQKALRDAIAGPLIRGKWLSEEFFGGNTWKDFRSDLESEFGEAGKRAGEALERDMFEGKLDMRGLKAQLKNITPLVTKFQRDIDKEILKEQSDFEKKWRAETDKIVKDANNAFKGGKKGWNDYLRSLQRLQDALVNVEGGFSNLTKRELKDNEIHEETIRKIDRESSAFHRINQNVDKFAELIGGATGRGSRNNFVNFMGSMVFNSVRLIGLIPKVAEGFTNFFGTIKTGLTGGGWGDFGKSIRGIVLGLGGFAVAAGALVFVLGPVIALLSGLLGILLALSSTVIFAVIGALGALASVLAPLALGIGGLVVGIITMNKKSQELKPVLKDLKDGFHDVGDAFNEGFDMVGQLQAVSNILHRTTGLALSAGRGMDRFASGVLKAFDGSAWNKFIVVMEDHLPSILGKLGRATGNAFSGLMGVFRALVPLAEKFSGWLEQISEDFSKWANSKAGQATIKQFFRDAASSVKSLGDFLGEALGLLTDLIGAGQKSGDSMFDGMTRGLKKFRDFLAEPVANPMFGHPTQTEPFTRLESWFEDARRLATALGHAFENAGDLMRALNDDGAKNTLLDIVDAVSDLIGFLKDAVTQVEKLEDDLGKLGAGGQNGSSGGGGGGWLSNLFNFQNTDFAKGLDLGHLFGLDKGPQFSIGDFFKDDGKGDLTKMIKLPNWPQILSNFSGIGGKIQDKIGPVKLSNIFQDVPKAISNLLNPFSGANKKIKGKIGPVKIGDLIHDVPRAVASLLNPFDGKNKKIKANIGPVSVGDIIKDAGKAVSGLLADFKGTDKDVKDRVSPVNVGDMIENASKAASGLVSDFNGVSGKVADKVKTNVSNMISGAQTAASNVVSAFNGVRERILNMIGGAINIAANINWPSPPGWLDKITASGGIFQGAQTRIIGEAGPEAVVPLNRPLSMVDPAVRWLSAIAQGKSPIPEMGSGGVGGAGGRTVNVDMTVVTPQVDPRAAAAEVVNHLVAVGY